MSMIPVAEGIELYCEEIGSGDRWLLTCQEGFQEGDGYLSLLANEGFHVLCIQIRGFGRSTHVLEDYDNRWWEIWADDAVTVADRLGIDRFFYCGVSHGAGIGWYICQRHPERVRGFFGIVAGPHPRGGLETSEARWRVIQAAQTQESWNAYVNERFGGGRPELTGTESEEEKARVLKKQQAYDRQIAIPIECSRINPKKPFNHCKTEEELSELLSHITVPTLLLGGMHDVISTTATMIRSGSAVPNAKTVFYDATHGLSGERPQEVVDDILLFCRQRKLY